MQRLQFERLDEATRAYLITARHDRGTLLPIAVANAPGGTYTLLGILGICLPFAYFFIFCPPLGNPLKETLILLGFMLPAFWFLFWASRAAFGLDKSFRSPRIVLADGRHLWKCQGATVEIHPLEQVTNPELTVTDNSCTLQFQSGLSLTKLTLDKNPAEAGGLQSFLWWHEFLRSLEVITPETTAQAAGRRVILARHLMGIATDELKQDPSQVRITPQGFFLFSAPPEASREDGNPPEGARPAGADPEILMAVPWNFADTADWRKPGREHAAETPETLPVELSPAFMEPPQPSQENRGQTVLPQLFAMTASAALIFYLGLHAIIYFRDEALFEIIRDNGFPADQVRAYLLDDRNTRHRKDLENNLTTSYSFAVAKITESAPTSDPSAGPVFRSMVKTLSTTPQPIWTIRGTGPAATEITSNLKLKLSEILRLPSGEGVFWADAIDGVTPHFDMSFGQGKDGSVKVSATITESPGSAAEPSVRITWDCNAEHVVGDLVEKLVGRQPTPPQPDPAPPPLPPKFDLMEEVLKSMREKQKGKQKNNEAKEGKSPGDF